MAIIFLIWLLGAISDRLWFWLDHSVPAWDQADYLNGALNYGYALQNFQGFNEEWRRSLWLLSNKIPPLHYILTAPWLNLFGKSEDIASLVMLGYSALLLIAVYGLGKTIFNRQVGIIAAILCQILPGLYYYRLEFLLDFPLTALVFASFWLLTVWKQKRNSWLIAICFGISLGLSLLLKQTAIFFLITPIIWVGCGFLKSRRWTRLVQLLMSLIISIALCFPWYRTNWLLILTSSKRATIDSAIAEGDPALNTLDAWVYYLKTLPYLLSWHLLIIPLVGLFIYLVAKLLKKPGLTASKLSLKYPQELRWLLVYIVGGYLWSSLNVNKDARYIVPLLPAIALFIALGINTYHRSLRGTVRNFSIGLAVILMLLNLFPIANSSIAEILSPRTQNQPYLGKPYPHPEIVQEIINTDPYLRSTLGVLPSTPEINQHNFSFYGGEHNFQVVGRQVGVREQEVVADSRSLNWFVTKTGDQGSVPEPQAQITNLVANSNDFKLHQSWDLPDQSKIELYQSQQPVTKVKFISPKSDQFSQLQITDLQIIDQVAPGQTVPIKYQWRGNADVLTKGLVLLTWSAFDFDNNQDMWLHDHALGFGMLDQDQMKLKSPQGKFQVTEDTAMLIPANIKPGKYQLSIRYLNVPKESSYEIKLNQPRIIEVVANINSPAITTKELDLNTQLRAIAPTMATGISALEPVFAQTARINQYDGNQSYLQQTEKSLTYRLANDQLTNQQKIDWSYAIALSRVLQQDVAGAIKSWQSITKIDPENPYGYAYLAFVYLYDWQPQKAERALQQSTALNPDITEVKTLSGVAALMQGRFIKAWNLLIEN